MLSCARRAQQGARDRAGRFRVACGRVTGGGVSDRRGDRRERDTLGARELVRPAGVQLCGVERVFRVSRVIADQPPVPRRGRTSEPSRRRPACASVIATGARIRNIVGIEYFCWHEGIIQRIFLWITAA